MRCLWNGLERQDSPVLDSPATRQLRLVGAKTAPEGKNLHLGGSTISDIVSNVMKFGSKMQIPAELDAARPKWEFRLNSYAA